MGKNNKIYSNSFCLLPLLISILNINGVNNVTSKNIKDFLSNDCISVSDFIEENLSTFVSKYNESSNSNWKATYIEDKKYAFDIINNEKYYYLDFDDDNGYAIVGNDYNFLDFSTEGDLSYTKDVNSLLWNEYDGFVYEKDGQYLNYDIKYLSENELNEYSFGYNGKIDSRYSNGSDTIADIPSYIKNRYGDGWYQSENKYLDKYIDVYQNDYSYSDKSEGNCTLSAYYGIFRYLRDNKELTKLPTGDVNIVYNKNKTKSIPTIYSKIHDSAVKYGFNGEANTWTSICMAKWGNEALEDMGYASSWNTSYVYMKITWTFYNQVVCNIDNGYPVMWNQARGNYGNHSMVVKGYETYKKDHNWWFIHWSESKHFMAVNDNWNDGYATTYIDYDGYSSDLINEGFGTFVIVRDYAW